MKNMSDLKERIKREVEKYKFDVNEIEIATLMPGIVIVWANGKRFGNYDINTNEFVSFMA
jgi:hypothetical protein